MKVKKNDTLCVILGAGFSKPAGLPLANEINGYFLRDNADTLLKFSSGEWKWIDFANDPEKNNGKLGFEHLSYGFILNHWVKSFIRSAGSFTNYEDFYQYILDNYKTEDILNQIYSLSFQDFLKKHPTIKDNPWYDKYTYHLTHPQYNEIISISNHLIGDLLYIRGELAGLLADYKPFIQLLKSTQETSIITLNHDYWLEILLKEFRLDYDDGFSIDKSPLIAPAGNMIKVFNGVFGESISIIKLHGSIDVYRYEISDQRGSLIYPTGDNLYFKTHNYSTKQNPRLVSLDTGEVLQNFHWNISPQFITGTRKHEIISSDSMYATLYSEFEKYINQTKNLLIIGYSYTDRHVNEKIISAMQSGKISKVVNVNPGATFPFATDNFEIVNLASISELHNSLFQDE